MSAREWKSGDVAMVKWRHYPEARAMFNGRHWNEADGCEWDGREDDLTLRPLVVIDPEDPDAARRLCAILLSHGEPAIFTDLMQAALREFADPKPPTCTASLFVTYGDGKGAEQKCDRAEGHEGPHVDGSFTWTAVE